MTTKHEVLALHRQFPDWSSRQIANALGCMSEYVRATYQRNGITGTIKGPARIVIPTATAEMLKIHAAARNISISELVNQLVDTIARDKMVDAILDDWAEVA